MTNRSRLLYSCLLLLLAVLSASAHSPAELDGFDQFVADALRKWDTPGAAITIVKDGKVLLVKGYGVRDPGTGAPMTKDTIFPIQSEAKAFTAMTAVMLRDEGKLDLDAPVSKYIPGFRMHDPAATLEVSIRDFLTHRSGLGAYGWLWLTNTSLDRKAAMEKLPHLPLVYPFRTRFRYANLGYVTAAHAVENVAGVPWERFTETRIFQPLGMTRTTFSGEKANADPNHIRGSMWRGGERDVPVPMQGTTPLTNSTGGIYSTAEDMAKWIQLQLGQGRFGGAQLVRSESMAEMQTAVIPTDRNVPFTEIVNIGYGLGWYVDLYRGEKLIEHGGGHWGVSSVVAFLPSRNLGVSVFVNNETDVPYPILLSILDRFMGKGTRDWVTDMLPMKEETQANHLASEKGRERGRAAGTTPSHPLADYAGTYVHPGLGTVTVTMHGTTLVAQKDDDRSALQHWHYDVFVPTATEFGNLWAMLEGMRGEPTKVQFLASFDGKVDALRINGSGEDLLFKKEAR